MRGALLVVAKAPVPGLAKTRLCPPATPQQAAEIAAAALLDTLDTVLRTPRTVPYVAFTGDLRKARRSKEISALLEKCEVFEQRGDTFADRLAEAHAEVARRCPGQPVVQIGMDTPQITPSLLASCFPVRDAAIGRAHDGGWWALGLNDPNAAGALRAVPMSKDNTGDLTVKALQDRGLEVFALPQLSDVDTMTDARVVAKATPNGRFARAVEAVR
ncbi:DUF2064 domain-containing protein [Allokutzneria sp. A3M-2-11 16]|uniref:TIGR04282 family arsenosugar biosynthesis glycosyltransferase n=1 Tax=Allokutzneria sp. A3M-2-11 16 TaxID=2962043 RepID=UPI0020B76DB9|nr:DUF2064 domain-containing protein [Allokutzneria sp. A3M-2-11 16]MCP3801508.1 DUF2064 domain-containing protein [Allokutzneria sp. A3M-2-11 16]